MGRRRELDDELIEEICKHIRIVFYHKTAMELCGLSRRSFYSWRARGEKELARREALAAELKMSVRDLPEDPVMQEEGIYLRFLHAVEKARADTIQKHLLNVHQAALGTAAVYDEDEDGNKKLDKKGRPILITEAVPPIWQASMRLLESAERKLWGRSHELDLALDETEKAGVATGLRITVVPKRETKPEEEE